MRKARKSNCTTRIGSNDDVEMFRADDEWLTRQPRRLSLRDLDTILLPPSKPGKADGLRAGGERNVIPRQFLLSAENQSDSTLFYNELGLSKAVAILVKVPW